MKKSKYLVAFAGMAMACAVRADISFAPYEPIYPSSGEVVPGEWNDSITKGQAYADANNVPMLAIGGSATCGHCHEMQTACNTEEFKAWAEKKQIVMVYGTDTLLKSFCRTPNKDLMSLPLVSVYWKKVDGSVIWESFSGLDGQMPSKEGEGLAAQLINSCDMYIGGWPQMAGYEYLAFTSNDEGARLEAEAGLTKFVGIPLVRDSFMTGYVSTNRLTAVFKGQTILESTVLWKPEDTAMSVQLDIPQGAVAGDTIDVTLYAFDGEERGSVKVFVIEPVENSPKNPFFVGERTAGQLGYGEWTMDLDVALAKYSAEPDSRLLALVGGSLWCPDCVMTDVHFLDREEFKAWALANKVILFNIDIPNNPNDPEGSPCLLTRKIAEASANYRSGRGSITDEAEFQEAHQSGAGYLSRHMVSDAAAAAVYERNRKLAGTNWAAGGWNNPNRANQNRPGVPVFYALTRKGEVAGCMDAFSSVAPKAFNAAYLARLDELLKLADADGNALLDGAWQTTKLAYDGVTAAGVAGAFSAVDLTDTFALGALSSDAAMQTVTVKGGDASVKVTVNLISVVGTNATTVATASGKLSDGVTASCTMTTKEAYYVQVVADSSGSLAMESAAANTTVTYALSGTREAIANPFSNDWTTTLTKATLPLYAPDGSTLAGFAELQLKKRGKLSVKISDAKKRLASLTGVWDAEIAADGTATAVLAKKGITVSVSMTSEGVVSLSVIGTAVMSSGECSLATDYGDFVGTYAVALPLVDATGAFCGDAYMTLTMGADKASRASGKMKYKIFLPDGKKLSGSTGVTGRDANFGVVPIAKTSGVNSFTAALLVRRNAGKAPSRRAVIADDGVKALWSVSGAARECGVFGSFINKAESLVELAGTDKVAAVFDAATIASSARYGTFVSALYNGGSMDITAATIAPAEAVKGFSFKLNRSTGVFQGRTALTYSGKAKVNAKFSGVILPDWYSDCECEEDGDTVIPQTFMPFGIGQCSFSDSVGGKSVKRSFPISLE